MIRGYEFGVLAAQIGHVNEVNYDFDANAIRILDEVITSVDPKTFIDGFVSEKTNLGVGEAALDVVYTDLINLVRNEGFVTLSTELLDISEEIGI